MRRLFVEELYKEMARNPKIWLLTGDLGYGLWDKIKQDFPDRFLNTGAAEQALMGLGVGLALEGKVPFVYSITTFLLYRPFETIRNYINREKIPIRLVASGRDKDYEVDGFSHWSEDARYFLDGLPNIKQYWPNEKEEIPELVEEMTTNNKPCFISLRR